jgi:hypothetical protein
LCKATFKSVWTSAVCKGSLAFPVTVYRSTMCKELLSGIWKELKLVCIAWQLGMYVLGTITMFSHPARAGARHISSSRSLDA